MDTQFNSTTPANPSPLPPTPPTPPAAPQISGQQAPPPLPPSSGQKNTGMALLSYIGILVVIPLISAKDDPFVKFHIKQGLTLLVIMMVAWMFGFIPFIGWFVAAITTLGGLVLMIIGILNAVNGKEEPLPLIGHWGDHFHI